MEDEARRARERARCETYRLTHQEGVKAYQKAYYLAHQDKKKAWGKAYRLAHLEEIKASSKAYRRAHREEKRAYGRAYSKAYFLAHREEAKAYMKAYRQAHPEEGKAYRQAHPEKHRMRKLKQRALKRGATVGPVDLAFVRVRDRMRCGICHKKVKPAELSYDHIVPLSKGGAHANFNLQVAHLHCNLARGTRGPAQMRLKESKG